MLTFLEPDTRELVFGAVRAALLVLLGVALAKLSRRVIDRLSGVSPQHRMLLRRAVAYGVGGLCGVAALREVGFDLSVLLGAAGLLTVAIGFASQTSASNLISGLFLIGERPFVLGDVIKVGNFTGEVVEIGLVSVHIRTFDNLRVRIPNETLFKSEIVNYSVYPIRRFEILVQLAHGQALEPLRAAVLAALSGDPQVLDEPRPVALVSDVGAAGVTLKLQAWCERESLLEVHARAQLLVHNALAAAGAQLPKAPVTTGELQVVWRSPPEVPPPESSARGGGPGAA